jgi:ketosteroid isomerase-like protein
MFRALAREYVRATRAVSSSFPVLTIWEGHHDPEGMPEIDLGLGAEEAVVTRPGDEVTVWRMPAGTNAFLHHLSSGTPLGAAIEAVQTCRRDFDPGTALGLLVRAGAFANCIKGQNNG